MSALCTVASGRKVTAISTTIESRALLAGSRYQHPRSVTSRLRVRSRSAAGRSGPRTRCPAAAAPAACRWPRPSVLLLVGFFNSELKSGGLRAVSSPAWAWADPAAAAGAAPAAAGHVGLGLLRRGLVGGAVLSGMRSGAGRSGKVCGGLRAAAGPAPAAAEVGSGGGGGVWSACVGARRRGRRRGARRLAGRAAAGYPPASPGFGGVGSGCGRRGRYPPPWPAGEAKQSRSHPRQTDSASRRAAAA